MNKITVCNPDEILSAINKKFSTQLDNLTIICDIDETLICSSSLIKHKYKGNDPKFSLRGPTLSIEGDEIVVCHRDMPNFLNNLLDQGVKILFVTKRSDSGKEFTYKQLNAIQIKNPIVLFTNGDNKVLTFCDYAGSLKGNLVVIDNLINNLYSFESIFGFPRHVNRVLLIEANFV